MGRMTDLLKNGDPRRRPPAELTRPVVVDPAPTPELGQFDFGDGDIPFIEVGGDHGPALRLLDQPKPLAGASVTIEPIPEPQLPTNLNGHPLPDGLFQIRFEPIHAGQLSDRGFGPELVTFHLPDHAISEQYRDLLAAIKNQLPGQQPKVLLFTAAVPETGTTTVAMNLAITIAKHESARVLIIDANWERPTVAGRLGLAASPGLRDVLAGRMPAAWAVSETRQPNMSAILAGRLSTPRHDAALPMVLDQFREEFDWIVIDSFCHQSPADLMPLPDCCDALYLVTRASDAGSTAFRELQQAILDQSGCLRGCVQTVR